MSADGLSLVCPRLPCQITEIPLMHLHHCSTMADCMSCIVLGTLKDNYDVSAGIFVVNLMALCHSQVSLILRTDINITETTYASFNMYLVINKCVTAVKVSNFSGHYLRNRSTLDIGVLGYIGIF